MFVPDTQTISPWCHHLFTIIRYTKNLALVTSLTLPYSRLHSVFVLGFSRLRQLTSTRFFFIARAKKKKKAIAKKAFPIIDYGCFFCFFIKTGGVIFFARTLCLCPPLCLSLFLFVSVSVFYCLCLSLFLLVSISVSLCLCLSHVFLRLHV